MLHFSYSFLGSIIDAPRLLIPQIYIINYSSLMFYKNRNSFQSQSLMTMSTLLHRLISLMRFLIQQSAKTVDPISLPAKSL